MKYVKRTAYATFVLLCTGVLALAEDERLSFDDGYVSEATCSTCHQNEVEAWSSSHHRHAMEKADSETVLADFGDAQFEHKGVVSKFTQEGDRFFVDITETSGKTDRREVKYTYGYYPLQQYLVEGEDGALQAYDVAWDVRARKWYKLIPEVDSAPGSRFHWSGSFYRWNSNCADCHSTNVKKRFSEKSVSYQTTWSNITVGCQACHGPAEKHVGWLRQGKPTNTQNAGFRLPFSRMAAKEKTEVCAGCHSRRSKIVAAVNPFTPYDDQYLLAYLRDGLYHADGQIDDEVYVYGSFLQSKMHAAGVTCTNCHDPHAGEPRLEGDAICTQCHAENPNPQFRAAAGNFGSEHNKHPLGSNAPKCVDCHMPAKLYMGIDDRRDHSFRVPRPDVSQTYRTPNACLTCHQDKDDDWSLRTVKRWYPQGRWRLPHFASALDAGRKGAANAYAELTAILEDKSSAPIVRATATTLLPLRRNAKTVSLIRSGLIDPSPLVRRATIGILQPLRPETKWSILSPLLSDPVRSVRIEAARVLANVPKVVLSGADRTTFERVSGEFFASRNHEADLSDSLVQLAVYLSDKGDMLQVRDKLQTALRYEPENVRAVLALADYHRRRSETAEERRLLSRALEVQPEQIDLLTALALFEIRAGNKTSGLQLLEKAHKLDPRNEQLGYTFAVGLFDTGETNRALDLLTGLLLYNPNSERLLSTMATYNRDLGKKELALDFVKRLKRLDPSNPNLSALERSITFK